MKKLVLVVLLLLLSVGTIYAYPPGNWSVNLEITDANINNYEFSYSALIFNNSESSYILDSWCEDSIYIYSYNRDINYNYISLYELTCQVMNAPRFPINIMPGYSALISRTGLLDNPINPNDVNFITCELYIVGHKTDNQYANWSGFHSSSFSLNNTTSVPEPSTFVSLLLTAPAGLMFLKRKR